MEMNRNLSSSNARAGTKTGMKRLYPAIPAHAYRIWSFPSVMLILLLFLPVEYLTDMYCPMTGSDSKQQTTSSCCPDSGNDETGSHHSGEECCSSSMAGSSDENEACLSCLNCGCFFTPSDSNTDLFTRDIRHTDISTGLSAPGGRILFEDYFITENRDPETPTRSGSVPIYLKNQAFLN